MSDIHKNAHAVIIGINEYQDDNIPELQFACADALAVRDVLIDPKWGKIDPDNVILLLDQDATQRNIRFWLEGKLPRIVNENDIVFVYYAGHGTYSISNNSSSGDGAEKFLVPFDAASQYIVPTGIPMAEIQWYFNLIPAKQIIFFIDSCYSGGAGGRTFQNPLFKQRTIQLNNDFLNKLSGEGKVVMTACDANELSIENRVLGHGLFTYFLKEGLKGKADINEDGLITVNELYDYVYKKVVNESRRLGNPMSPIQKGEVKGRIYVIRYETDKQKQANKLSMKADCYYTKKKYSEAYELYQKILELTPRDKQIKNRIKEIERILPYKNKKKLSDLKNILLKLNKENKITDNEFRLTSRLVKAVIRRQIAMVVVAVLLVLGLSGGFLSFWKLAQEKQATFTGEISRQHNLIMEKEEEIQRWQKKLNDFLFSSSFVLVKGDTFEMGNLGGNGDHDKTPEQKVIINDFEILKYEITNDQFCVFLNNNPNRVEGKIPWLDLESPYCQIESHNDRFIPKIGYGNHPVAAVSWSGAQKFAKWAGGRFPTEVEWEYAARAGGRNIMFPNGNQLTHNNANFSGTGGADKWEGTSPVGSFPPNALGLYDMAGNLWEWCQDCYEEDGQDSQNNPKNLQKDSKIFRVIRGGSWNNTASNCNTIKRRHAPADPYYLIGFRVVRSVN